uniref:Uncharacterized protein n=1 Tax=Mesocestoides corti TaxID=53468 RepID=A0A5K3EN67_MESCO
GSFVLTSSRDWARQASRNGVLPFFRVASWLAVVLRGWLRLREEALPNTTPQASPDVVLGSFGFFPIHPPPVPRMRYFPLDYNAFIRNNRRTGSRLRRPRRLLLLPLLWRCEGRGGQLQWDNPDPLSGDRSRG